MYIILTASKDTYITDKIIDNDFRAKDANVGRAGTIDIFKLYEESTFMSASTRLSSSVGEISRGLIKFDLSSLSSLTGSSLDLNSSNFKAKLRLYDIMGGQATPSNYSLVAYPLSQSFGEGVGRDVASFSDLDVSNFVTASVTSGTPKLWFTSGANAGGLLGSDDIDIIHSATNASPGFDSHIDFGSSQTFEKGSEDLVMDITKFVSASVAGQIDNHGLRISFSGSNETDNKTRFVKRFASRHSSNLLKVPQIHISWDDSISDNHEDFVFDVSGSLFLRNYVRGLPANLRSGSVGVGASEITGENCILLKLQKQDFTQILTGSQRTAGTDSSNITGTYSVNFALDSFDNRTVNPSNETFADLLNVSGSIEFDAYWISVDETLGYHTGSLKVTNSRKSSFKQQPSDLMFNFINLESKYSQKDEVYLSVFVEDLSREEEVYKVPYTKKSISLSRVYYRLREASTGKIVIPFDDVTNSTKLSSDGNGLSFFFRMSSLNKGYSYYFDLLVKDYGENRIYEKISGKFKVG